MHKRFKETKEKELKSKPKVFQSWLVWFFFKIEFPFYPADCTFRKRIVEKNSIDKTKLDIIYISVSLLGCFKPLYCFLPHSKV